MSSPRVNKVLVTLINISLEALVTLKKVFLNKATLIVLQSDVQSAQF